MRVKSQFQQHDDLLISPSADGSCPPPPPQAVDSDLLTDICDVNILRVSALPLPLRMLLIRCMTLKLIQY